MLDKAILLAMRWHDRDCGNEQGCYASNSTLAAFVGSTPSSVRNRVAALLKLGTILSVRRRGSLSHYFIVPPKPVTSESDNPLSPLEVTTPVEPVTDLSLPLYRGRGKGGVGLHPTPHNGDEAKEAAAVVAHVVTAGMHGKRFTQYGKQMNHAKALLRKGYTAEQLIAAADGLRAQYPYKNSSATFDVFKLGEKADMALARVEHEVTQASPPHDNYLTPAQIHQIEVEHASR
jgi:hypothetical protein